MIEYLREDFPEDAIRECSSPGPCDDAVAYWVEALHFDPPREATRRYLAEYGAWDDAELADHEKNRHRLFWTMMCDFSEWDGLPPGESNRGSEAVWLEG